MASSASATDPIQRLFLDKIKEVKTSNKGLDETHQKRMQDEIIRLQRVYSIEDEKKIASLEHKFDVESPVSLHDIDDSKDLRQQIHSGEYKNQLTTSTKTESVLLASIPDQTVHDMCLPPLNKPDPQIMIDMDGAPNPVTSAGLYPDYERTVQVMTVDELQREMCVKFGENMPTVHDDGPQRDKVNYPREPQLLDAPPTRYHLIPESWFQFFYPKTGVTGPYAFAASFFTFLMSKEWLVMEHELLTAFSSICIFAYAIPKYGPQARKWLIGAVEDRVQGWDKWQEGNIKFLDDMAKHYKEQASGGADIIADLYNARKQDVEQQLEYEYRLRLKSVYDDTKRRLNYLVAVADSQRQIQQSNLVNMVITNVMNSLGPKQESEVLEDCIANLKRLSIKNANAI